jgi:uncharacterized protein YdhG (YjbR/CyaY superfamily)
MHDATDVDGYIAQAPEAAQAMMKQIRAAIKEAAPQAKEKISYKLPFYEYKFPGYKGRLAYFGAFKEHVSLFIVPRDVPPAIAQRLKPYKASKSAIHFPLGKKVPTDLIKDLVKLRRKEIDQSE